MSIILGTNGRCKSHGGFNSGAPDGNKNALKTGRYESILLDALDDDERELYNQVDTQAIALVDEELRVTTIRERRMLKRIQALAGVESGMTIIEQTRETISSGEGGDLPDRVLSQLDERAIAELTEALGDGGVLKEKAKSAGTLGQIQAIEGDLTAVQAHKARLIKLKHDLETKGSLNPGDDADFDGSLWEDTDDAGSGAGS